MGNTILITFLASDTDLGAIYPLIKSSQPLCEVLSNPFYRCGNRFRRSHRAEVTEHISA